MLRSCVAIAAGILLFSSLAQAQVRKYSFLGVIDTVNPSGGSPEIWDSASPGDPFTVDVRVETSVVATPDMPTFAAFFNSVTEARINVNGIQATLSTITSSLITMRANDVAASTCTDSMTIVTSSSTFDVDFFTLDLIASAVVPSCPLTDITSSALPTELDPNDFSTRSFSLDTKQGGNLDGTVNSVTITPGNDDCIDAMALPSTFGVTNFDATGATTDGMTALGVCDYGMFGDEQNHNDIWFTYTPDVGGCTYISTLNMAGYDTRMTIYDGFGCPDTPGDIIACVDDEVQPPTAPFEAGLDVELVAGKTYTVRVGTFTGTISPGPGALLVAAGPGADVNSGGANPGAPGCNSGPVNDDCANAIALPSTFGVTPYDASGATTDGVDSAGFCDYGPAGDDIAHNDIWFTYTPDFGGCTYISTLGLAGYDTRLAVYDIASCPDDVAHMIACVDEEALPAMAPFEAGLDVDLAQGQTYLIRLGTFNGAINPGTGSIRIEQGPVAVMNGGGINPGAPGCETFLDECSGDGGDQAGCTDCPCMNNATPGTIGGCLNSAGTSARLHGSGSVSTALPSGDTTDLRFELTNGPPTAFCVLQSGAAVAPQNMANPCFGLNSGVNSPDRDGLRCAVQGTRRHGGRSADANGDVGLTNNGWGGQSGPPAGIANAGGSFVPGQTRHFQVTYRDDPMAVCMRGLNTTQSVRLTFTAGP